MKDRFDKGYNKSKYRLCKKFFSLPFPEFYPPQLPCSWFIYAGDLPVKRIRDVIVFGIITDCVGGEPIEGALVKVFCTNDEGQLVDICETISGCKGYYMLNLSEKFEGKTIRIMATCSSCSQTLEPCQCPN
ncbi:MAG: hypothetical protein GX214_02050 [Clostridiales bacterium]|nr:hypothetical protein [Clostridiales bacterium]